MNNITTDTNEEDFFVDDLLFVIDRTGDASILSSTAMETMETPVANESSVTPNAYSHIPIDTSPKTKKERNRNQRRRQKLQNKKDKLVEDEEVMNDYMANCDIDDIDSRFLALVSLEEEYDRGT
jgi:hypothetical protein